MAGTLQQSYSRSAVGNCCLSHQQRPSNRAPAGGAEVDVQQFRRALLSRPTVGLARHVCAQQSPVLQVNGLSCWHEVFEPRLTLSASEGLSGPLYNDNRGDRQRECAYPLALLSLSSCPHIAGYSGMPAASLPSPEKQRTE